MKFQYSFFVFIVLASISSCQSPTTNTHDGTYVFIDSASKNAFEESITIQGSHATLNLRSIFNHSKLKISNYTCFQRPNRIDLPMSKQRPISIPVNKDGNLVWDNKIFIKQRPILISNPNPDVFQEIE